MPQREGRRPSIPTIGNLNGDCASVKHIIALPNLTSFLATNTFDAEIKGTIQIQDEMAQFGATRGEHSTIVGVDAPTDGTADQELSYIPNLAVTYWSFRLMIGFGVFSAALALAGQGHPQGRSHRLEVDQAPRARRHPGPVPRFRVRLDLHRDGPPWPRVVYPNLRTRACRRRLDDDVARRLERCRPRDHHVPRRFTLVYGALAVVWGKAMHRYAIEGVPTEVHDESPEANPDKDEDAPPSFAY